jgi:hypothetical protein
MPRLPPVGPRPMRSERAMRCPAPGERPRRPVERPANPRPSRRMGTEEHIARMAADRPAVFLALLSGTLATIPVRKP